MDSNTRANETAANDHDVELNQDDDDYIRDDCSMFKLPPPSPNLQPDLDFLKSGLIVAFCRPSEHALIKALWV